MTAPTLHSSERLLNAWLESTDDLLWVVDPEQFTCLAFNSAFRSYVAKNYGAEPTLGEQLQDRMSLGKSRMWLDNYRRALSHGPFSIEHETHSQIFQLSFSLLRDGECVFGISVLGRDITARKRAEQRLRSADERLIKVIRTSLWLISITTLKDGIIVDLNDAYARLLGYDREDLMGQSSVGIWVDVAEHDRLKAPLFAGQRVDDVEVHLKTRAGRIVTCTMSAEVVEFDGQLCVFSSAVDITDRKVSEESLKLSEARYRTLVDFAPDAIVVLDADQGGRFVDANENACRLFGYSREQLLELGPANLGPPTQPGGQSSAALAASRIEKAVRGDKPVFEWTVYNSSGDAIQCEVRLVRLPSAKQTLVRGSLVDIGERKQLELQAAQLRARLNQAQRLEAIGTLAGGIAHDFNNILNAIIGSLDLALMILSEDSEARQPLADVGRAATRATELVRQILAFSRQGPYEVQSVVLSQLVKEVVRLIRAALPSTITIHQSFDSWTCVKADPSQLYQVVMNLCTNAGQAMAERGGTLEITVRDCKCDEVFFARHPELPLGRYACLTVKDTGCGIPEEYLDRIFEPFFTTQPKGRGTGLGLSVVHGIVKESGGTIAVSTELGCGSAFEIILPVCDNTPDTSKIHDVAQEGNEHVLIVDDEVDLTDVARKALTWLGYKVSAYNSPMQALAEFLAAPTMFDIVISDMTMPGLTGDALAREIRRHRKDIPIILMTGYTDRITPEQARILGADEFVEKPLRIPRLTEMIRKFCDRPQTPSSSAITSRPSK